jgi:DNA (cytosine-5)-methyltransferase 1
MTTPASRRPRLLDLFCGAGGAAMGYHRAGFEVVGVDIKPQPHYPFEFQQGDAMEFPLEGFDVIHASPPCQRYSMLSTNWLQDSGDRPDLLPPTLSRLRPLRIPWVVENIARAPLQGFILCGAAFGLGASGLPMPRHRRFESNAPLMSPGCACDGRVGIGVYGNGTTAWHRRKLGRNIGADEWREAMGIPWMVKLELKEAVPPAYTEFIGSQLLEHLRRAP